MNCTFIMEIRSQLSKTTNTSQPLRSSLWFTSLSLFAYHTNPSLHRTCRLDFDISLAANQCKSMRWNNVECVFEIQHLKIFMVKMSVLKDMLTVEKGEVISINGSSGSGKFNPSLHQSSRDLLLERYSIKMFWPWIWSTTTARNGEWFSKALIFLKI